MRRSRQRYWIALISYWPPGVARAGGLFLKTGQPCQQNQLKEREKIMKDNNRVLIRQGARDLSEQEVAKVNGAFPHTNTACTFSAAANTADGDKGIGEC
jgi:hypothetical protein